MLCPTCGADVPESKFCQNCGAPLALAFSGNDSPTIGEFDAASAAVSAVASAPVSAAASEPGSVSAAASASAAASEAAYTPAAGPSPSSTGQIGVYQWNDVPQDPDSPSYSNKAPATAFVLSIVGLVLALAGFSLVSIVPALICCIIAIVLNSKYNKSGKDNPHGTSTLVMSVIGIIAAVAMSLLTALTGFVLFKAAEEYEAQGGNLSALIEEAEESAASAATSSSHAASSASASAATTGTADQNSQASPTSSRTAASTVTIDPLAFDAQDNVSLYAILELDGSDLQDMLEANGYIWVDSAGTWMTPSGALLEVQDQNGTMPKDAIDRLDAGASDTAAVFVMAANGYATPQETLTGLSDGVVLKDTYVSPEGDIAFAIAYGSDKEEHLVAITGTGNQQQTALVFTKRAIDDGLFSEITGVNTNDSLEDIWKTLKGN